MIEGNKLARLAMVESQVRCMDVLSRPILDSMEHIPREAFFAPHYAALAYSESSLPICNNEYSLPPLPLAVYSSH